MTKGWYDFVCRSIMPTTNRSELTVERAVLIHSIIIGENINVEEIIAKQFYKFIYKTDLASSLPFPSIIAAHNNHHKCIHNHKFTNNKRSLQTSTLTLTPPCHRFIGGLTNNKRKVGGVLKPSTQGWIAWMTS
ncbi:hypothetical protein PIB30_035489 [Stylosanthes scabra]|uniref:Putative plant transposon protein domain-containing protein n=1 Tax=Stylosanthes scabra TaxID=79078 RepID=A0ABU6XB57_9FABA|nr:hypothetical protein [Stylosanthes scabra]